MDIRLLVVIGIAVLLSALFIGIDHMQAQAEVARLKKLKEKLEKELANNETSK